MTMWFADSKTVLPVTASRFKTHTDENCVFGSGKTRTKANEKVEGHNK